MRNYSTLKQHIWILALIVIGCQSNTENSPFTPPSTLASQIISDASSIVIAPTYQALAERADILNASLQTLSQVPTQENLVIAQNNWRATRKYWELSEAFLFGPVSTDNIDPGIDTWPVNRADLDSVLLSNQRINDTTVANSQESLKGFHPLEYMLFGVDGNKKASDFTSREWAFTLAQGSYLKKMTQTLFQHWNVNASNSFYNEFLKSGNGGTVFTTKEDALLEMARAMGEICSEVGEGKIGEVVISQNPALEESPFSKNSMVDFRFNMEGVKNMYTCSFNGKSGASLSQFVKQYNLSLDQKINNQIAVCQQALLAVSLPFGEAIFNQKQQLNAATDELVKMEGIINDELVPLIQQRIND